MAPPIGDLKAIVGAHEQRRIGVYPLCEGVNVQLICTHGEGVTP